MQALHEHADTSYYGEGTMSHSGAIPLKKSVSSKKETLMKLFKTKMEDFASKKGWKFRVMTDDLAILSFQLESGDQQFAVIQNYNEIIEIYSPTFLKFSDPNSIPHQLSTALLAKNSTTRYGFWTINKTQDEYTFSYMHNCRLSGLTADEFESIVGCCVFEVSKFEQGVSSLTKTSFPTQTAIQQAAVTTRAQQESTETSTQSFIKGFSTEAGKEAGRTIGAKVAKVALSAALMALGVGF